MKKISCPVILTLCALLLAACQTGVKVSDGGEESTKQQSEKCAGYITSGVYYLRYYRDIPVDGETEKIECEAAKLGGNESERSGASPSRIGMVKSLDSYLVDYQNKTATKYPQRLRPEFFDIFDFDGLTYAQSGSITDGESSYAYDEYTTGSGKSVRFCYDGGALAGLQLLSGGEVVAAITMLMLTDNIPDYMFDIPADFTVTEGS